LRKDVKNEVLKLLTLHGATGEKQAIYIDEILEIAQFEKTFIPNLTFS